jgi:hypothetical protein
VGGAGSIAIGIVNALLPGGRKFTTNRSPKRVNGTSHAGANFARERVAPRLLLIGPFHNPPMVGERLGQLHGHSAPRRMQPPFAPLRSGPKVVSKLSRQKQIPSSEAPNWDALKKDEFTGLYHTPDSPNPYTGWVKKLHGNGKVALLGVLKDGRPAGLWTWWDENGLKEDEKRY